MRVCLHPSEKKLIPGLSLGQTRQLVPILMTTECFRFHRSQELSLYSYI